MVTITTANDPSETQSEMNIEETETKNTTIRNKSEEEIQQPSIRKSPRKQDKTANGKHTEKTRLTKENPYKKIYKPRKREMLEIKIKS